MVPIITDSEKSKRRDKVKAKRRRRGKKCKPLPPRRRGSDRSWKEFKVAFFYSEGGKHQHVAFTHGNHVAAGKLLRREADRLRFPKAGERVGLGATPPVADGLAGQSQARGGGSVAALRLGAEGHDPLPGVPGTRLADR